MEFLLGEAINARDFLFFFRYFDLKGILFLLPELLACFDFINMVFMFLLEDMVIMMML